jgi:hypothetical protein
MLQTAAAAGAVLAVRSEMPAFRLDPLRRDVGHRHDRALVLVDRQRHGLAGQREGNIDRPERATGNAVAGLADLLDGQRLGAHASSSSAASSSEASPSSSGLWPASRYSSLPSPPEIGEGMRPRLVQPMSSTSQRSSSAATAGAVEGSFSRPALLIASRPASNCGLTSRMQWAPGSARSSAGGSASFSEMNETRRKR